MINRNLRRALGALAILAAAFAVIAAGAVPAIGAQLQNVFVTNSVDNPVPTAAQGVTQVAGTVAVDDSTPIAVAVEPQPAAAEEVVQFARPMTLQADFTGATSPPLYDVPDGKRLIIDRVTANVVAPEGSDFTVAIGQEGGLFSLPLTPQEVAGVSQTFRRHVASEVGPIYVDSVDGEEGELIVRVFRDAPADAAANQVFSVNGRLVDRP